MVGETVSHYKVLEKLGEGGMGVVFKARDLKLDRLIALKFLPPDLTRDPEAKKRFVREAKAASALQHNNICTVHDIDETDDGRLFIVMDLYEGETLTKKIERGRLKTDEATEIAVQVAQGLAEAHHRGIVHRDIKPANILVTEATVAKILDFGLAKLAGQSSLTHTGSTAGTVAYMSPEQVRGELIDPQTDIWSLGVTMFEMVTGERPFKGEYPEAVIYAILNNDAPDVTSINRSLPGWFARVVSRCLRRDRSERYGAVDEVLADLRRRERAGVAAPRSGSRQLLQALASRSRIPAVALVVVGLVAVFLWVFLWPKKTPEGALPPVAIVGSVVDDSGGTVEGATITINAVHFRTKTRTDGTFSGTVPGKKVGERIVLVVSHPGYRTRSVDWVVASPRDTIGRIMLIH